MALSLPKLDFFNRLSARGRVVFLLGAIIGFLVLIYLITRYLSTGPTTGSSHVAEAPRGLQSVPGGQMTPEYQRAIEQANAQRAQQAQITGKSAIPTLINVTGQNAAAGGCVICLDQTANIKYLLDDWLKQGKVVPEVANSLLQSADKNPVVIAFSDQLNQLIHDDKLSPDQARQLLDTYKKQHANALLQESAAIMDSLIKSSQLPLDAANQLLLDQKNIISPSAYSSELKKMVADNLITQPIAQQLLSQYTQQRTKEIIYESIAILQRMGRNGEIMPDIEKNLIELEMHNVPIADFSKVLQDYVTAGKLAPVVSNKILAEYNNQKAAMGAAGASLSQIIERNNNYNMQQLADLVSAHKITQDVADQILALQQKNPTKEEYAAALNQLVQANKLAADVAKQLNDDYAKTRGLQDLKQRLTDLQANNASPPLYAEELKNGVQSGLISPDEASQLLQEYQALSTRIPVVPTTAGPGGKTEAFAKLQQQVQQTTANAPLAANQFTTAQTQAQVQAEQQAAQQQRDRIHELMMAMGGQAEKLVASWGPPNMTGKVGDYAEKKDETSGKGTGTGQNQPGGTGTSPGSGYSSDNSIPLIKAGTILFAVLDTAVNSDYPDSPVLATVVDGKYKSARLIGKLVTAKGVSGQMDRISLNFTLMDSDTWTKSKTVSAYAIDPDTARTSVASSVNYHYLMRFGSIMATSFLQGYASSITNAGTSTTGIFGTSTTHPTLNPSSKFMVGLGQVGQTLGNVTQNYVNIPPTVKVDSGVSLGILFMSDVSQ